MIFRLFASALLLVAFTGCKSYDIFVKDPAAKDSSQSGTQSDIQPGSQTMTEPQPSKQQISINAPERAPASTIICSNEQQRRPGNKVVIRKECTDMDGVLESNDGAAALAEW
ncbi:MAG: hypothetical protein IPP74_13900 [Alphaproteobacteria bacterium]|nr:hypothetical protein [Alphaproteobacteria bacterium]